MPDLSNYRFSVTHEWVLVDDAVATVGISDNAQSQLGDVIFLDLPAVGTKLAAGERFGTIESVKAASDLYAPVGGTVVAVNGELGSAPERVNSDPFGEGWLIKLEDLIDNPGLLDEKAYSALTAG